MIESFNHKGRKRLFETGDRKLSPPDMVDRIAVLLARLDAALVAEDLDQPSLRLHPLKADLEGCWAITVRANWRIVFRFEDGATSAVELIDHHRWSRPCR